MRTTSRPREPADVDRRANLNRYLRDHFGFSFEPRIGLHYGPVLVGQLGHPDTIDFRVIGDAVNTASRIEGSNRVHGTRLFGVGFQNLIAKGRKPRIQQ